MGYKQPFDLLSTLSYSLPLIHIYFYFKIYHSYYNFFFLLVILTIISYKKKRTDDKFKKKYFVRLYEKIFAFIPYFLFALEIIAVFDDAIVIWLRIICGISQNRAVNLMSQLFNPAKQEYQKLRKKSMLWLYLLMYFYNYKFIGRSTTLTYSYYIKYHYIYIFLWRIIFEVFHSGFILYLKYNSEDYWQLFTISIGITIFFTIFLVHGFIHLCFGKLPNIPIFYESTRYHIKTFKEEGNSKYQKDRNL